MKNINQNAVFIAASATLADLSAALDTAKAEESRLLAQLSRTPGASPNPLDAALALLGGKMPDRTGMAGLNQALDAVRLTIATLEPGIQAQRAAIAKIRDELSATVCNDAQQAHATAAQGIADCLIALGHAQAQEASTRAAIEAAGFRCLLPALQEPSIDFEDSQSVANRYLRDCQHYAKDVQDGSSGALGRPQTVHLLRDTEHGAPGDVVNLAGRTARQLIRAGACEATADKPRKVARLVATVEHAFGLDS